MSAHPETDMQSRFLTFKLAGAREHFQEIGAIPTQYHQKPSIRSIRVHSKVDPPTAPTWPTGRLPDTRNDINHGQP